MREKGVGRVADTVISRNSIYYEMTSHRGSVCSVRMGVGSWAGRAGYKNHNRPPRALAYDQVNTHPDGWSSPAGLHFMDLRLKCGSTGVVAAVGSSAPPGAAGLASDMYAAWICAVLIRRGMLARRS